MLKGSVIIVRGCNLNIVERDVFTENEIFEQNFKNNGKERIMVQPNTRVFHTEGQKL
jgi:hypothetical protein